jgi:hypothetical protein
VVLPCRDPKQIPTSFASLPNVFPNAVVPGRLQRSTYQRSLIGRLDCETREEALAKRVTTAFRWVKAVWRAFGSGSGLAQVTFVNCSEYKTPSCELQDLRRGKRHLASRIG